MARRTKEEAQETRHHILDTAEQVFLEKGVSRTSLADIAGAAGLTRGAIYWHFKNKADLFQAMMDRVVLPMELLVAEGGNPEARDPVAIIRDTAVSVLDQLTRDPQCQRVFEICCHKVEYVDEMLQLRERHIDCRGKFLGNIESGLRNAAKQGLLAAGVNPRHAAVGLHALVDGLIMNWLLEPGYFPLARAAKPLIDNYIDGLRARAVPAPHRQRARKPARPAAPAASLAPRRRRIARP
jgi:TetR/AcrR family acrAB operon transcriptional repressor